MVLYTLPFTSCRTNNSRERLCDNNRGQHSYLLTFWFASTTDVLKDSVINHGMQTVRSILAAAHTFGASSATCESSFSTMARILTYYRRSMLQVQVRKSNLVLLAFESDSDLASKLTSDSMKSSVPQEKVMVIDVEHILTWSQCCYYILFFMSASETVRTAFLGQSLMLTTNKR